MEKFWAFLKYYKESDKLDIDPKLEEYLSKFKSIEDFRVVEVSIVTRKCVLSFTTRITVTTLYNFQLKNFILSIKISMLDSLKDFHIIKNTQIIRKVYYSGDDTGKIIHITDNIK